MMTGILMAMVTLQSKINTPVLILFKYYCTICCIVEYTLGTAAPQQAQKARDDLEVR